MIYDGMFHPTLPSDEDKDEVYFRELGRLFDANGIAKSLAINLPNINEHISQTDYFRRVAKAERLYPVPCVESQTLDDFAVEIMRYRDAGMRLLKIHPRTLGMTLNSPVIAGMLQIAREGNFGIILCTYPYSQQTLPGEVLHAPTILNEIVPRDLHVILAHGGVTQILEVCEWARTRPDTLLVDLSFTITQLWNSSIRLDLHSIVHRFDRRVVLGSDYPYESLASFSQNSAELLEEINPASAKLISMQNLEGFLEKLA